MIFKCFQCSCSHNSATNLRPRLHACEKNQMFDWTCRSTCVPIVNELLAKRRKKMNIASIVQGSGVAPSAFVLNASDLQPLFHLVNLFLKYADDTDLVVPASHSHTIQQELDAISIWASANNLKLNV